MNKAIDDIRSLESEKKEAAVHAEVGKMVVMEASIEQLRQVSNCFNMTEHFLAELRDFKAVQTDFI